MKIIGRLGEKGLVDAFVGGARDLLGVALIIGLARGIVVIMDAGHITETILHRAEGTVVGRTAGTGKGCAGPHAGARGYYPGATVQPLLHLRYDMRGLWRRYTQSDALARTVAGDAEPRRYLWLSSGFQGCGISRLVGRPETPSWPGDCRGRGCHAHRKRHRSDRHGGAHDTTGRRPDCPWIVCRWRCDTCHRLPVSPCARVHAPRYGLYLLRPRSCHGLCRGDRCHPLLQPAPRQGRGRRRGGRDGRGRRPWPQDAAHRAHWRQCLRIRPGSMGRCQQPAVSHARRCRRIRAQRLFKHPSAQGGCRGHHHPRIRAWARARRVTFHDLSADPRPPFKEHPMPQNRCERSFIKLLDFTPNDIRHLLQLAASLKMAKAGGY